MVNRQEMLISTKSKIGSCVECHNKKQLLNMCHIGAINVQLKNKNHMKEDTEKSERAHRLHIAAVQ